MKKSKFFINTLKYNFRHLFFRKNNPVELLPLERNDERDHMTTTEYIMLYGLQEYGETGLWLADIALFGLGVLFTLLLDVSIVWIAIPIIAIVIRCFAAVYFLHKFDLLRKSPEIVFLELAFLAIFIINHFYVCLTYIFYFLFENMVVQINHKNRRDS